jgi:hypothetical protein
MIFQSASSRLPVRHQLQLVGREIRRMYFAAGFQPASYAVSTLAAASCLKTRREAGWKPAADDRSLARLHQRKLVADEESAEAD